MDQFYFESGYIDDSYFVYTADAQVSCDSLFTPTLTIDVVKNTFAVLDSSFTVDTNVEVIRNLNANTTLTSSTNIVAEKTVESTVNVSTAFSINAIPSVFKLEQATATLASSFTLYAEPLKDPYFFFNALDISSSNSTKFSAWHDTAVDPDDNSIYAVGCEAYSFTAPNTYTFRLIIAKYSASGKLLWQYKLTDATRLTQQSAYMDRSRCKMLLRSDQNSLYITFPTFNALGLVKFQLNNFTVSHTLTNSSQYVVDMLSNGTDLFLISTNSTSDVTYVDRYNTGLSRISTRSLTHTDGTTSGYAPQVDGTASFNADKTQIYIPTTSSTGNSYGIVFVYNISSQSATAYRSTTFTAKSLQLDSSNNIYVASTNYDIAKFNSSFTRQWAKNGIYGGSLRLDASNNIVQGDWNGYVGGFTKINGSTGDLINGKTFSINTNTGSTTSIVSKSVRYNDGFIQVTGSMARADTTREAFIMQIPSSLNYSSTVSSYSNIAIRSPYRDNTLYTHNLVGGSYSISDITPTWSSVTPTVSSITPGTASFTPVLSTATYTDMLLYIPVDAKSTLTSAVTLTATAEKQLGTSVSLTSAATVTVDIQVIKVASAEFTGAFSPILTAGVIKNDEVTLDTNFSLAVVFTRVKDTQASASVAFAQTTLNDRVRYTTFDSSAQFTFDATTEIIEPGVTVEAYGDWTTSFDQQSINYRTRFTSVSVNSEFTQDTYSGRIQEASVSITGAFSPSMTATAITNTFAVLDSTSALTVGVNANRSADIALASIINLGLQGDKFTGYVANYQSEFTQSTTNNRTRETSADISSEFTLAIEYTRYRTADISVNSSIEQTTNNSRTRDLTASLQVDVAQTTTAVEIIQLSAGITANATLSTSISAIRQGASDELALFSPSFQVNAVTNTFAVLDSVASITIDATKQAPVTANLAASSTLSAVNYRIRPYVATTVQGVHVNKTTVLDYVEPALDALTFDNLVFSFWAKRDINNVSQVLIDHSRWYYYQDPAEPYPTPWEVIIRKKENLTLIMENNNITLSGYQEGGSGSQSSAISHTWTNTVTDFEWHQYVLTINPEGVASGRRIYSQLYVDGVDKGLYTDTSVNGWYYYVDFTDTLHLGYDGVAYRGAGNYTVENSRAFTGSYAQLWVGQIAPETFNIANFYNNGYVAQLPSGYVIYDDLAQPFSTNLEGLDVNNDPVTVDDAHYGTNYALQGTLSVQALLSIDAIAEYLNIVHATANFAVTCDAKIINNSTAFFPTAECAITVNANRLRGVTVNINGEFTQSAVVISTSNTTAGLTVDSAVLVPGEKVTGYNAELSSLHTILANAVKTVETGQQVQAEFTCDAIPLRILQLSAELQVQGFELVSAVRTGNTLVDIACTSELTVAATTGVDSAAVVYSNSILDVSVIKTARIVQAYSSTFEADISIDNVRNFTVTLTTQATMTVAVKKTTDFAANISAFAQVLAITDASKIVNTGPATYQVQAACDLTADLFKDFRLSALALLSGQINAVKTVRPQLQFAAIATELTAGRAISFDKNLTIKVKRETSTFLILNEVTTIELKNEYRQIEILEERPILPVHSETRVNMVRITL